jgi:hypothetical protein
MSVITAILIALALVFASPSHHHCGKRCHERRAEQCAKVVISGGHC